MNKKGIVTKTAKGMREASGTTHFLAREQRTLLKAIDGKSTPDDLAERLGRSSESAFGQVLERLAAEGYIQEALVTAPLDAGSEWDLDFTGRRNSMNAQREAEAEARRQAEETARRWAAERSRRRAEARVRREAEERARQQEQARLDAEKAAREAAQAQAQREAEAQAKREAEVQAQREAQAEREAEAAVRREAEARAAQQAQNEVRRAAEEAARKAAAEQAEREAAERIRLETAQQARRLAAEARAEREAQERARRTAQEQARREAEQQVQREAEERAQREAEEQARRERVEWARRIAEQQAQREAEARAQREAEQQAQREAEQQAQREAEQQAQREAEAQARREAEEQAQREAEAQARREAEQASLRAAQEHIRCAAAALAPKRADDNAWREAEESAGHETEEPVRHEASAAGAAAAPRRLKAGPWVTRATPEGQACEIEGAAAPRPMRPATLKAGREARKTRAAALAALAAWRRPMRWRKPLVFLALALAVGGLVLLHLMSFDSQVTRFEKIAAEQFQQPVSIHAVHLRLLPRPHWQLEAVTIGDAGQIRAPRLRVIGESGALLRSEPAFTAIEIDTPLLTEEGLGWLLLGRAHGPGVGATRIEARGAVLRSAKLGLPPFDARAEIGADGNWHSMQVVFAGTDLAVELMPAHDALTFSLRSAMLAPLFFTALPALADFSARGTATRHELRVTQFEGRSHDGTISGSARLRFGGDMALEGEASAVHIDMARLMPGWFEGGLLDGTARFVLPWHDGDKLAAPRLSGSFVVRRGVLSGVDMGSVLKDTGRGGRTRFTRLEGVLAMADGGARLRQLELDAGAVSARGNVDVAADRSLHGRIDVTLSAAAIRRHAVLELSGPWRAPYLKNADWTRR